MRRREVQRLATQLDRIEDRLKTIEVAFLVSGPNNPVVADAYNGLRQQVIMAASERRVHLTQLASFASAVDDGASAAELASLVREWMRQHSLVAVDPRSSPEAYEIVGSGPVVVVERSAYADAHTGAIITLGHAIASRSADEPAPPTPDDMPHGSPVEIDVHEHEEAS